MGSPAPLPCTRIAGAVAAQALLSSGAVRSRTAALPVVTESAAAGSTLGLRAISSRGVALRLVEILASLILIPTRSILLAHIWTVGVVRLIEVRPRVVAGLRPVVLGEISAVIARVRLIVVLIKFGRGVVLIAASAVEIVGAGIHVVPVYVVHVYVVHVYVVDVPVVVVIAVHEGV